MPEASTNAYGLVKIGNHSTNSSTGVPTVSTVESLVNNAEFKLGTQIIHSSIVSAAS